VKRRQLGKLAFYGTFDMFHGIAIETQSTCNRTCPYCPNITFDRSGGIMPTILFEKIIGDLAAIKYRGEISFSFYNEPLLDKRIPEFCSLITERLPKATITLFTNGDFLTRSIFINLAESGVKTFCITQHGSKEPDIIRLKNAEGILYGERILFDKGENMLLWNRGGLIRLKNPTYLTKCDKQYYPTINWKGDFVICCNDYLSKNVYGNVASESIEDIWKKPEYSKIRKDIKKGTFDLGVCKACAKSKEPGLSDLVYITHPISSERQKIFK